MTNLFLNKRTVFNIIYFLTLEFLTLDFLALEFLILEFIINSHNRTILANDSIHA